MKRIARWLGHGVGRLLKWGIFAWLLLLVIWQVASLFISPDFLPGPWPTFLEAIRITANGMLPTYIGISYFRIAVGWILGSALGVVVGLLLGQLKVIRRLFEPLVNFFRFVPAIAFLTLFLMWFGAGETPKIIVIIYACFFPIVINTLHGVATVNETMLRAARSQGAGRWQVFRSVVLPAAVPQIFVGLRLGLSAAIIAIVAAEMLAANSGIGYLIYTSRLYFKTSWIFIGVFVLGLTGFILDRLILLVGKTGLRRYMFQEHL
jgi:NitT/TauT family transport system permease protein